MTDQPSQPDQQPEPTPAAAGAPAPPPYGAPASPQAYAAPGAPGLAPSGGQLGKVRSTGTCILLFIVTLGIYGWFWYYNTHEEMKRHTGEGIGGVVAFILGIFVSIVMVFLTPYEVGRMYQRRGQREPVSALTGLWVLIPFVGAIIWFVKTNGALNDYWRSLGAS